MGPSARLLRVAAVVAVFQADDVVFAEVVAGLHLYNLDGDVPGFSRRCVTPTGMSIDSVSRSRSLSSPLTTPAVPLTTTQCSASGGETAARARRPGLR